MHTPGFHLPTSQYVAEQPNYFLPPLAPQILVSPTSPRLFSFHVENDGASFEIRFIGKDHQNIRAVHNFLNLFDTLEDMTDQVSLH